MRLSCLQHCKREFLDMKGNPDADNIPTLANQLYQNEHKHKHKINFFEYLSDILNRADVLQRSATPKAYRDTLPDRWKKNEQGQ